MLILVGLVYACQRDTQESTSRIPYDRPEPSLVTCDDPSWERDPNRCEDYARNIRGAELVYLDGVACEPEEDRAYCQVAEPLESKCKALHGGGCPDFLELLEDFGWLAGEPDHWMYVSTEYTAGEDRRVVQWNLPYPLPTSNEVFSVFEYFDVHSGELFAIKQVRHIDSPAQIWCCDEYFIQDTLYWGDPPLEPWLRRTFHDPADFEVR